MAQSTEQRRGGGAPTEVPAPTTAAGVDDSGSASTVTPDGATFTRIDDPVLEPERRGGEFATLDVVGAQGFVIGGHEYADDGSARPTVWRSVDAATWARDDLPLEGTGARVTASVVLGDRLLLFGDDPLADQPVAWTIRSAGDIESIAAPVGSEPWSVAAAQSFGDGALLWGQGEPGSTARPVFAVVSPDGEVWQVDSELNDLLDRHGASSVIDVASGPAGAGAVLATDSGDFLVLVHDSRNWAAWVLDAAAVDVAGIDAAGEIRLAGAVLSEQGARPAIFAVSNGQWEPSTAEIVSDDRNAGFQRSAGDRLHDTFLDGRVLTGNVATAEIVAVPAGGGAWTEAAYPDAVSGQGQPEIAEIARFGDVTLGIAGDRPAIVRLDGFAVTPLTDPSFPGGSSSPSAEGLVAVDDRVTIRGAYTSTPAGPGLSRRQWSQWGLDAGGRGPRVFRDRRRKQLELVDLEVARDGSLIGVGYEAFVPANFDGFIQPYEWLESGGLPVARQALDGNRTVRFQQVADAGAAIAAAGTVFDKQGQLELALFRRADAGTWQLVEGPPPDALEAASNVALVDMCPLPDAGAVLFARYGDDRDEFRTYATADGATWQRFAPEALSGASVSVLGCSASADGVLVFGTVEGESRLWRTVDGEHLEAAPLPYGVGVVDAAVDERGGIWILTSGARVIELSPDGEQRSMKDFDAAQLESASGASELTDIAVTSSEVVVLGTWNGGVGLWTADRGA